MTKKYKIHEAAKDFDIQSKDLIELVSKYFDGEKKYQTALEEKELDLVLICSQSRMRRRALTAILQGRNRRKMLRKSRKNPQPSQRRRLPRRMRAKRSKMQNRQFGSV